MQASWNQWGGSVGSGVSNYASSYPTAVPSAVGSFTQMAAASSFPATSALSSTAATPTTASQFPISNSVYGQQQQQQQWQQWEQWTQQYAQWHQQYGDKYQGPMPTIPPAASAALGGFSSVPPLPQGAPSAQPPPPDTVPPTIDKAHFQSEDSNKRAAQDAGKDDAKKQKTGKSSKSESVEDLIEQEKTFDGQFKSWEASFLKWKEQNANHPDKVQYKQYEAKWESWREQLLQKREILRKKRENKEAEVAAAAAAAKEVALSTTNVPSIQQSYSSGMVGQSNPYVAANVMYSMPNMYSSQDMQIQPTSNYMPNYPMYNMPPPPNMPGMLGMPSTAAAAQDAQSNLSQKITDSVKSSQSLEFLSSGGTTNAKSSIPGLDLVSTDKNTNPAFLSNIPPNSSLFSYNQDVTKPLHTSDDKPFNFPAPSQPNYSDDPQQNQYSTYSRGGRQPPGGLNRAESAVYNHYQRTLPSRFSSYDTAGAPPNLMDRSKPLDDRFGNQNYDRSADSRFSDRDLDSRFNDRAVDSRFGDNINDSRFNDRGADSRFNDRGVDSRFNDRGVDSRFNDRGLEPRFDRGTDSRFNERGPDSRFNNDYKYRSGAANDFRNEMPDRGGSKFGNHSSTGNFQSDKFASDKFAKYLEDEYDDSRFRDPEPLNDGQQYNSRSNYGRDDFNRTSNFSNYRQNFQRGENDNYKRDFNDRNSRGNFDRSRQDFNDGGGAGPGGGRPPFDRSKLEPRFDKFGNKVIPFSRTASIDNVKDSFGSRDFGPRGGNDAKQTSPFGKPPMLGKFDSKLDSGKPVSLLDLPMMKPPETFESKAPFSENVEPTQEEEESTFKSFSAKNRFSNSRNDSDQNFYSERDSVKPPLNSPLSQPKSFINPGVTRDFGKNIDVSEPLPAPVVPVIAPPVIAENFIPDQVFEYDHISRNTENGAAEAFEPIYVFDYSHGKKKTADFITELITAKVEMPKVVDEPAWEGGSWENEPEKKEILTPLSPRKRNSNSESNKKNFSDKHDSYNSKDLDTKEVNLKSHSFSNDNDAEKLWSPQKEKDAPQITVADKHTVKLINDLLYPPGRHSRPIKIVVIMRGPPGSGKTYAAKLIKDKEVEMGGSAPRILSLDDYFTVENDVEEKDPKTGKMVTKKEMQYEYEAALEPSYEESLFKSFKKTVSDGFFPFIIVDCINDKLKKYEEMCTFANSKGFQVFICEMEMDLATCSKRNIHNRTESEISKIIDEWEKTPLTQTLLDIRSLLQSAAIADVDMVDESAKSSETPKADEDEKTDEKQEEENDATETKTEEKEEVAEAEPETETNNAAENEDFSSYMEVFCASKWENMENTEDKLDRLDGVSKKRTGGTSFKEWLQLPEESESDISWYASDAKTSGELSVTRKKRVRWADLEERVAQQKMRAIGFVVGQTDWNRMMDPSFGGNKLTQTKYIYK